MFGACMTEFLSPDDRPPGNLFNLQSCVEVGRVSPLSRGKYPITRPQQVLQEELLPVLCGKKEKQTAEVEKRFRHLSSLGSNPARAVPFSPRTLSALTLLRLPLRGASLETACC